MSEFDPAWLRLREPADRAARNEDVLANVVAHIGNRPHSRMMDIGAGTGAMLRFLAPRLTPWQTWTLVDHADELLIEARQQLIDWADEALDLGVTTNALAPIQLKRGHITIDTHFSICDLARDPLPDPERGAHLITSSAFFDLTSADFVEQFVNTATKRGLAIYAGLEVDGRVTWSPPHPSDGEMQEAFEHDQAGDKGFGKALGGKAPEYLSKCLVTADYQITSGSSDWRVGSFGNKAMHQALCSRLAADWAAVAETNRMVAQSSIERWRASREGDSTGCIVGHQDIFATPA